MGHELPEADGPGARRRRRSRASAGRHPLGPRPKALPAATEASSPSVDLGPLDGYIAFHLRRAQETAVRAFAAMLGEAYKPGRFPTLLVIRLNPGLSQSDVCRAIGRDKSTMSPLIRELVQEGLVVRRMSDQDRRSVHLRLTPKGEAAVDQLQVRAQAHEARLDALAGDAKPELIRLLKSIVEVLT